MKTIRLPLVICGLALAASSCQMRPGSEQRSASDAWLVEQPYDLQYRNGVVAQHTLYPYHFIQNSAKLNELGQREVGILAEHYREYPGEVILRRGGASDSLYQARLTEVSQAMVQAGVDPARFQIVDRLPAGPGIASERLLQILADKKSDANNQPASGSGMAVPPSDGGMTIPSSGGKGE